ncbi:hypothetical protein GCM10008918_01260 [Lactobacillus kefiranofaciens subsp. kefiranofaciens]|uniref:Uncharacterized protein n=1 Tax=Lactobacillus kefiranofaciens TaxID=267818 RepID=A0ABY0MC96_9LACO|nr:hypothetical protein B8W86_05280 [Lactobacillus kefiranofaciens]SDA58138.1 hypothetical protein SAMN02983011_01458 [Lactobacillus kefiranofaciens]
MIKKIRIVLFVISSILPAAAIYTLFMNIPKGDFSIKDSPIIIYFLCIFATGILLLFPNLNYLLLSISTLLLIITITINNYHNRMD